MLRTLGFVKTRGSSVVSGRLSQLRYLSTHGGGGGGNPGMNAEVFRSVFQPLGPNHPASSNLRDGRYLWRWDWHLRNFIYAMIPPACAYGYVCFIEWYMADMVKEFRESVKKKKVEVKKEVESVQVQTISLEERVATMEQHLLALQAEHQRASNQAVVVQAKSLIKLYRQVNSTSQNTS